MLTLSGHTGPRPWTSHLFHWEREVAFNPQAALRQTLHQRHCLGDLGDFLRRRKAFERRREDGVGVDLAGRRLIELGKLQRGLQAEAACALFSGDCDGGEMSFLGGGGIFGMGLQQDVAADAVQEGVCPALARLLG